jgi:hypothetical protein
VRYYDPSDELYDLAMAAWEAEPRDKRWLIMEYDVHGLQFNVHFTYPEEVDPKGFSSDRRQAALDRRYGDKPVIYPPIPEYFQSFD